MDESDPCILNIDYKTIIFQKNLFIPVNYPQLHDLFIDCIVCTISSLELTCNMEVVGSSPVKVPVVSHEVGIV